MLQPFAKLRFVGARFEDHGMPLETLPELVAYRNLIVAVAKELYRRENPDKRRLPKHFEDRIRLELRNVEGGSAAPIVERRVTRQAEIAEVAETRTPDEADRARDLVERAIEAVSTGQELPAGFPVDALAFFAPFGHSLREDEQIFISAPRPNANEVPYNKEIRNNLLLRAGETYSDDFALLAEVMSIEIQTGGWEVRLPDGQRLRPTLPLGHEEISAVAEQAPGTVFVGLRGQGTYNRNRKIEKIDALEEVTMLEPGQALVNFNTSLRQINELTQNWDGNDGVPIPVKDVDWVKRYVLNLTLVHDIPIPILFPITPNVIRSEWRVQQMDVSAEFDLSTRNVYLHSLSLETRREAELEVAADEHLSQVAAFLSVQLPEIV
jgi:hypothetical protein